MIKTKNRNHSINKLKNLRYDRRLQYRQPRQESGLCFFFHSRAIRRSVSPKFIKLCTETPGVVYLAAVDISKHAHLSVDSVPCALIRIKSNA